MGQAVPAPVPAAQQQKAQGGVRVYELPTLGKSYRIMRGFIDGGMARGIADKATREARVKEVIEQGIEHWARRSMSSRT